MAEGSLWVGQYRERKIHQIDPSTGTILRTLVSDRFVTGVTWVDGELWHGSHEDEVCELRHIEPTASEVLTALALPKGVSVSGLGADDNALSYAGGGRRREDPRSAPPS